MRGHTLRRTALHYPSYPYAVIQLPHNWAAGALQWTAAITAASRDELQERMSEDIALQLLYGALDGKPLPEPLPQDKLDLADYDAHANDQPYEIAYVHPAWLSVASVAIQRALEEQGLSIAGLAKQMRVRQAVVERLTDPFYFQHSAADLRRVADGLNMDIAIRLLPRDRARNQHDPFDALPTR